MFVKDPLPSMTLHQIDSDQLYTSDLSSESSAVYSNSSCSSETDNKNLASLGYSSKLRYYSDSDSGIVGARHRPSNKECQEYNSYQYKKMSPKDGVPMLESQDRNASHLSTQEESDFWTYDDQSLLSEESVRRSCHQIYSAIQDKSPLYEEYRGPSESSSYHTEHNPYATNTRKKSSLDTRENPYETRIQGSSSSQSKLGVPSTKESTLTRSNSRSVPKICITSLVPDEPEDIVRAYARPASVVPVQDSSLNGKSPSYGTVPRNEPQYYQSRGLNCSLSTSDYPRLSYSRNSSDSSRISLVSMDQTSWKQNPSEYVRPYYETQMFKSQPCLSSSASATSSDTYNNETLQRKPISPRKPLHTSSSYNTINAGAVRGRRGCGFEAFGNLNERNRIPLQGQTVEHTESSVEKSSERQSRGSHCRRSKSFAEKIQRGSQSFRSACSAFRRAFSQERIYRPEKQERQQQEFINSTMVSKPEEAQAHKDDIAKEKDIKEERSPLLSSGRLIVNGIREKLGGGKEILANCNSSKLAVHRRKAKHIYQPPQLVTTHVNSSERDSETYSDGTDSQPSSLPQSHYGNSPSGWHTDPTNQDVIQRAWGHLIQLNVDGSQVIELSRPRGLHFGFFVARGRVKDNRGVFVSRMRDVLTQKALAGILEVGDEILEIEGVDVSGADIFTVNSMMANKQTLLLTVLPYISRKDI